MRCVCFVVMCLPGGTGRRGKSGLSGGLDGGGPARRSVSSRGPLISPLVSHWPLASLPWVWKNRLRCSVHPPFASLPRRSPRGVVGPSASSSRRWNYRAGARLKCSWKSRPGAWRLLQHCHLPARGLLSLISLLSAFPLTGINRNQSERARAASGGDAPRHRCLIPHYRLDYA